MAAHAPIPASRKLWNFTDAEIREKQREYYPKIETASGKFWAQTGKFLPLEELQDEGRMALYIALRNFNPALGIRFSTYLWLSVRCYHIRVMKRWNCECRHGKSVLSLDYLLESEDDTLGDRIPDPNAPDPETLALEADEASRLWGWVRTVPNGKELFHELAGEETLQARGDVLGICREAVRHRRNKVKALLKRHVQAALSEQP